MGVAPSTKATPIPAFFVRVTIFFEVLRYRVKNMCACVRGVCVRAVLNDASMCGAPKFSRL